MALSESDKELLVNSLNGLLNATPSFVKAGLGADLVPKLLSMVPGEFRKYRLEELMDAMYSSWNEGKIKV